MRITTKTDYAIMILLELSASSDGPVSLISIAKKTEISEPYLQRIAARLKKAKIIKPKLGAFGGYLLNQPSNKITLTKIINAVGDNPISMRCLKNNYQCSHEHECQAKAGWSRFQTKLNQLFTTTTLSDLSSK